MFALHFKKIFCQYLLSHVFSSKIALSKILSEMLKSLHWKIIQMLMFSPLKTEFLGNEYFFYIIVLLKYFVISVNLINNNCLLFEL